MASRLAKATLCLSVCLPVSAAAAVQSARQGSGAGSMDKVTPLQKLIQMLNGMAAKGKQEKHTEKVEFTKFHEWCDNVKATRRKSIKEGEAQIEQLTADIIKAESDAKVLSGEIEKLSASIKKQEGEHTVATDLRAAE